MMIVVIFDKPLNEIFKIRREIKRERERKKKRDRERRGHINSSGHIQAGIHDPFFSVLISMFIAVLSIMVFFFFIFCLCSPVIGNAWLSMKQWISAITWN